MQKNKRHLQNTFQVVWYNKENRWFYLNKEGNRREVMPVFFRSDSLCNKSPQAYNRLLAFHPLTFALVGYMCTHREAHKRFHRSKKEGPLFKKKTNALFISTVVRTFVYLTLR